MEKGLIFFAFFLINLVNGQVSVPENPEKNIVNTQFIVAMSISGFFVIFIITYAIYTYILRLKKGRQNKMKNKIEEKPSSLTETDN